jgi:hypothetical protein
MLPWSRAGVLDTFSSLTVIAILQDCIEVRKVETHKFQLRVIEESREAMERLLERLKIEELKNLALQVHIPALHSALRRGCLVDRARSIVSLTTLVWQPHISCPW